MSANPTDLRAEIVIVRRKSGGGDEGHHGGAWKIAYADFVTAMMAFFLVMWLINASNEATRAQVASYFNPIKLTDSSTAKRGLTEPKETFKTKQPPPEEKVAEPKAGEMTLAQEDKLMHDPQRILASLAAKDKGAAMIAAVPEAEPSPLPEDFDPFDPQTWQPVPEKPVEHEMTEPGREKPVGPAVKEPPEIKVEELKPVEAPKAEPIREPAKAVPHPDASPVPEESADKKLSNQTIAAAAAIRAEILSRFGAGHQPLPANLDVEPTFEGVLISLTDRHEFGMFALGSAEPDPQLVTLIATIAGVLSDKPGFVVVRGHTDARPYRNKKYDNWQLSTARAHMAVYMLERGGLDSTRIRRVEGHADRDLKDPGNPQSERNRRIEILLGGLTP